MTQIEGPLQLHRELPTESSIGEAELGITWTLSMNAQVMQYRGELGALVTPGFRAAFGLMLTAIEYAQYIDGDVWDFAVSIKELRCCGLTENDLRLLVRLQLVEHASEIVAAHSTARQFRPTGPLAFSERSCFVLTVNGSRAARLNCRAPRSIQRPGRQIADMVSADSPSFVPSWNAELRTLKFRGRVVKRFARPAVNQALVLSAFEEEHWPVRIDDPLAPHPTQDVKRRLCDTIKCLNQGQDNSLVRFRGDGSGEGVLWEPAI